MILYLLRRVLYAVPIALSVSLVCFMLVHIAPGDPVNAIVPPDAPQSVVDQVRKRLRPGPPAAGAVRRLARPRAQGDLGRSLATGRPVLAGPRRRRREHAAPGRRRLRCSASSLGCLLGALAGTFRGTWIDRACDHARRRRRVRAALLARHGAGDRLHRGAELAAGDGRGPRRRQRLGLGLGAHPHLILPAVTLAVIPMGIITRTVRGLVATSSARTSSPPCAARACGRSASSSTSVATRRRARSP